MKLKKAAVKLAVLMMVAGSTATNAFAVQPQVCLTENITYGIVTPYWSNISDISPNIYFEGKTLYSEVYVAAQSTSAKITGTMYLEKYSSGKWTKVTSWIISGTGYASISKSYTGRAETEYRTRVVVTIGSETAEAISDSCII